MFLESLIKKNWILKSDGGNKKILNLKKLFLLNTTQITSPILNFT